MSASKIQTRAATANKSNPVVQIINIPEQHVTTNRNAPSPCVSVPVSQEIPMIVSSQSLQTAHGTSLNLVASSATSARTETFFTFGRTESDIATIFNKLDIYLKHSLTPIAPNWFHGITGFLGTANPTTLNIYQLKSTPLGLSLPKSIQMFSDQTIRILVESRDCSKALVGDLRIETPESLKELITKVNSVSLCSGLRGFDSILVDHGAVKERKVWFSNNCNRLVLNYSNNNEKDKYSSKKTCRYCQRMKRTFQQRVRRREKKTGNKSKKSKNEDQEDTDSQFEELLSVKKNMVIVNVRDVIEDRLQNIWTSLGLDKEAQKYKEKHRKTANEANANDSDIEELEADEEVDPEVEIEIEMEPMQPEIGTTKIPPRTTETVSESESEDLMDL